MKASCWKGLTGRSRAPSIGDLWTERAAVGPNIYRKPYFSQTQWRPYSINSVPCFLSKGAQIFRSTVAPKIPLLSETSQSDNSAFVSGAAITSDRLSHTKTVRHQLIITSALQAQHSAGTKGQFANTRTTIQTHGLLLDTRATVHTHTLLGCGSANNEEKIITLRSFQKRDFSEFLFKVVDRLQMKMEGR